MVFPSPWDSPRLGPGRKAQAELVATIGTLFQRYAVEPVLLDGQSPDQGNKRLVRMVDDSAISGITMQTRKLNSVALMWWKRRSGRPIAIVEPGSGREFAIRY